MASTRSKPMTSIESTRECRKLFGNLIDYAGVFPPARLEVAEALRRYDHAASGEDGWMLGSCLLRASQLPDLPFHQAPRRLGVVLDLPAVEVADHWEIRQIEMITSSGSVAEQVRLAAKRAPVVYAESRRPTDLTQLEEIAALRKDGIDARAKIRTGGVSPESFPSVEQVARFLESALELGVPFKATAGLHHPIRPSRMEGAIEHGFINLLAAVRAALTGDVAAVRDALSSTDQDEFDITAAMWRKVGQTVAPESIRMAFRSFGSCSFEEPAYYLRELGILPPNADQ